MAKPSNTRMSMPSIIRERTIAVVFTISTELKRCKKLIESGENTDVSGEWKMCKQITIKIDRAATSAIILSVFVE